MKEHLRKNPKDLKAYEELVTTKEQYKKEWWREYMASEEQKKYRQDHEKEIKKYQQGYQKKRYQDRKKERYTDLTYKAHSAPSNEEYARELKKVHEQIEAAEAQIANVKSVIAEVKGKARQEKDLEEIKGKFKDITKKSGLTEKKGKAAGSQASIEGDDLVSPKNI